MSQPSIAAPISQTDQLTRESTVHVQHGGQSMPLQNQTQDIQPIAIIGLSGRYPQANNIEEFWANLKAGKNCVTDIPAERWDNTSYYSGPEFKEGKSYSQWGGFIEDHDKFDPLFFRISPREAEQMDPQERIFIETVWAKRLKMPVIPVRPYKHHNKRQVYLLA